MGCTEMCWAALVCTGLYWAVQVVHVIQAIQVVQVVRVFQVIYVVRLSWGD